MNLVVDFKDEQDIFEIRVAMRAIVRKAIFNTLVYEGFDKDVEVSVTFTDNEQIQVLNEICHESLHLALLGFYSFRL